MLTIIAIANKVVKFHINRKWDYLVSQQPMKLLSFTARIIDFVNGHLNYLILQLQSIELRSY